MREALIWMLIGAVLSFEPILLNIRLKIALGLAVLSWPPRWYMQWSRRPLRYVISSSPGLVVIPLILGRDNYFLRALRLYTNDLLGAKSYRAEILNMLSFDLRPASASYALIYICIDCLSML